MNVSKQIGLVAIFDFVRVNQQKRGGIVSINNV